MDKISNDCHAKLNWLNESIGKRNDQAKHVDPSVTSDRVNKERETLQYSVAPVLNRPKPAPKKEEPKEEVKEEKKEEPKADEAPALDDGMEVD